MERLWVKKAEPSVAMVARFQCKAIGNAEAYVYVSAGDARGRSIGLYPDQGGYGCQGGTGAFAFATPPGTTQVKLRVRVTGHGSADFSDLNLGVVGGP